MRNGDKAQAQRQHALNRYAERYGKVLTPREYREAIQNITGGNFVFVERQSNRRTVFRGVVGGIETLMVYDSLRKRIVTFLLEGYNEGVRHGLYQGVL